MDITLVVERVSGHYDSARSLAKRYDDFLPTVPLCLFMIFPPLLLGHCAVCGMRYAVVLNVKPAGS